MEINRKIKSLWFDLQIVWMAADIYDLIWGGNRTGPGKERLLSKLFFQIINCTDSKIYCVVAVGVLDHINNHFIIKEYPRPLPPLACSSSAAQCRVLSVCLPALSDAKY